jgi:hypothetical protein
VIFVESFRSKTFTRQRNLSNNQEAVKFSQKQYHEETL